MVQQAAAGSIGAGQQGPTDSNTDFEVVAFMIAQKLALLEIMIPVQVIAVHAGQGSPPAAPTVDVQLLVSQLDGAGNVSSSGQVSGLSCLRLQGGPWAIIVDPAVNDFGFIIGASRDTSNVVGSPGINPPGSLRKYSYSDAVYIGGILNAVPAAYIWLKSDGTLKLVTKDGVVVQSDGSGNLSITGNVNVTGSITATGEITRGFGGSDSVTLGQHTHPGNNLPPRPGT